MYTVQMDHALTRSEAGRKTNLAKHYTARVSEKKVVGLMQGFVKPSASQKIKSLSYVPKLLILAKIYRSYLKMYQTFSF